MVTGSFLLLLLPLCVLLDLWAGGGGERNKNFLKHFQKMLAKFFFPNRNVIYALKKSKYKF
jgi:hypothetical protein